MFCLQITGLQGKIISGSERNVISFVKTDIYLLSKIYFCNEWINKDYQ